MNNWLTFKHWVMWSGKSLDLIKVAYNYNDRWLTALVFNHSKDNRFWTNIVWSRTNLNFPSVNYDEKFNFHEYVDETLNKNKMPIDCILVDESQFLTKSQVEDLAYISTFFNIPICCYGLKTDYKTKLFEWSKRLLELASNIEEIESICWCWNKATINCKVTDWHIINPDWEDNTIDIGWDEKYISLCYKHFKEYRLK